MLPETVRRAVQRSLAASHFFVPPGVQLRVEHVADEQRPWEIYRGHLLDRNLARQHDRFVAWHLHADEHTAPLISVRWQPSARLMHVTRNILTHSFEAYEDTPGVILSRPTQKWGEELVGTIDTGTSPPDALQSEIETLLFLAVIGTSRLPITSLESPLPDYTLGQLAYLPAIVESNEPCHDPLEFLKLAISPAPPLLQQAKALETALRAIDLGKLDQLAATLQAAAEMPGRGQAWAVRLLRTTFNGAALSPYTQFADALIGLVERLGGADWFGPEATLATIGYMLRHLARHLTAFDLTLFHSFGANYPDALFLDALLKAYLRLVEQHPDSIERPRAVLLRRALRHAVLSRRQYEGHRVPDAPTSMGENARVLPAPFVRVPEEQIFEANRRRRTLFADEPTDTLLGPAARRAFEASLADVQQPGEMRELGLGMFLDRPLGVLLEGGAVDRTPLLSYEAFSRFVVRRRLAALKSAGWIDAAYHDQLCARLNDLPPTGLPVAELNATERPGVVSLADAGKVAADFVLLRTTRGSLDALLAYYDLEPLHENAPEVFAWLTADSDVLFAPYRPEPASAAVTLRAYAASELRLEIGFPPIASASYRQQSGVEVPAKLQVLRVRRSADGPLEDVRDAPVWLEAQAERCGDPHR